MPDPIAATITAAIIEAHIAFRLNAAQNWAGDIVKKIFSADAIEEARRQATSEVFSAIAYNRKHGAYPTIATMVDVTPVPPATVVLLPPHDGEPGLPVITAFENGPARTGLEAKPEQIDSWRSNPSSYTGFNDGKVVAHDQPTADGKPSPLAYRWSLEGSYFKFTGKSATIPLVVITDALLDGVVLRSLAPAIVKLAMPKLVKPGSPIFTIARQDAADGRQDLMDIRQGAMAVRPLSGFPDVSQAQRQGVA